MPPKGHGHTRSQSDFVETSRTNDFVYRKGFWVVYLALILLAWITLRLLFPFWDASIIWTITLQSHAIISWILLHWLRGAPGGAPSGQSLTDEDVAHLVFWEQLDGGKFYGTKTRRGFIFIPILLFFLSLIWTQENLAMLACNAASTFWLLISKLESARGVRLFGLNKLEENNE